MGGLGQCATPSVAHERRGGWDHAGAGILLVVGSGMSGHPQSKLSELARSVYKVLPLISYYSCCQLVMSPGRQKVHDYNGIENTPVSVRLEQGRQTRQ